MGKTATPLQQVIDRLKLARQMILKIQFIKKKHKFTEESFVGLRVPLEESTNEEEGRAAMLLNLMAITSNLGYYPPADVADIIGKSVWDALRSLRNVAGHEYSNIPGKDLVDYRRMWKFIDENIPEMLVDIDDAICKKELVLQSQLAQGL